MVLELARPSEPWCFAAGSCFFFFEAIDRPASAAAAATCEQLQATDSLEKSCFSRISDDTLGSFLAWF